ncbi:MAG: nitroreductase family protein, partial [Synergistaceae bacterium]|nr:nitroreductase family protein [Synergistaceae bacterium]
GTPTYIGHAAVNLVYVQDLKTWNGEKPRETIERWGFSHAGAIMQNVYLFAASKGWNCAVRGTFEEDQIRKILGLNKNHIITLVQSVGPYENSRQ